MYESGCMPRKTILDEASETLNGASQSEEGVAAEAPLRVS